MSSNRPNTDASSQFIVWYVPQDLLYFYFKYSLCYIGNSAKCTVEIVLNIKNAMSITFSFLKKKSTLILV